MSKLKNFVGKLHNSTNRNYLERMQNNKSHCMTIAQKYDYDYWDGKRDYGYGGYKYIPKRWYPVAKKIIDEYNLDNNSSILDIGCGKGFLLYEIKSILPDIKIHGFDISSYALNCALDGIKENLFIHKAQEIYPFSDMEFDLAISLGCLHNLYLNELKIALNEITRVSKQSYIMVESYRNDKELFNLQCWALTCKSFFNNFEWQWVFKEFGYNGDYEFIYFE
tara:strand:- start:3267 stop:3932 length:666 start_codon:yes stop_codon:yes gene_type:complete